MDKEEIKTKKITQRLGIYMHMCVYMHEMVVNFIIENLFLPMLIHSALNEYDIRVIQLHNADCDVRVSISNMLYR